MFRRAILLTLLTTAALFAAVYWPSKPVNSYPTYDSGGDGPGGPIFNDAAESNATVDSGDVALEFIDVNGNKVALADFRGKKNAVLVFTRGIPTSTGQVCPYCTAQTSRLAANYHDFARRDAEVLAVFPGEKARVNDFLEVVKAQSSGSTMPFPIVLDEQFAAVDQLGIRGDQAKPSTYILDKQGNVRFAYVGAHIGDRPSVKALLEQLDAVEHEQGGAVPSADGT